jgi:uncharacterized membrane protein
MEDMLRLAHVIGAAVLFGTGAGIAFFMVMAHRTRDPRLVAHVAGTVVVADLVFTATAVILQPITGYLLARVVGWPLAEGWILLSLALYVVTGLFWLPVVFIQIKMRVGILPPRQQEAGSCCRRSTFGSIRSGLPLAFLLFSPYSASSGSCLRARQSRYSKIWRQLA